MSGRTWSEMLPFDDIGEKSPSDDLGERAARAYDEARTQALLETAPRCVGSPMMESLPGRRSAVMSPSEWMLALVKEATS